MSKIATLLVTASLVLGTALVAGAPASATRTGGLSAGQTGTVDVAT